MLLKTPEDNSRFYQRLHSSDADEVRGAMLDLLRDQWSAVSAALPLEEQEVRLRQLQGATQTLQELHKIFSYDPRHQPRTSPSGPPQTTY